MKQEFFHVIVAVLAEKLQESEYSAEGLLVCLLVSGLEFIKTSRSEFLTNDVVFDVEVIICIDQNVSELT